LNRLKIKRKKGFLGKADKPVLKEREDNQSSVLFNNFFIWSWRKVFIFKKLLCHYDMRDEKIFLLFRIIFRTLFLKKKICVVF